MRHGRILWVVLLLGPLAATSFLIGQTPKATPRAEVPAGSVAIANEQTVVYPYAISGGWSVIGRTPLRVFDARREQPSLFSSGDRVRFRAIERAEYLHLSE